MVSAAVARSGVVERALRPLGALPHHPHAQIVAAGRRRSTVLSAFVKNIGALAMLMPVAFQLARRTGTSPSRLLMPMSFGSLLGGIVTLVGTSPNIIVSRVREEILGEPFQHVRLHPGRRRHRHRRRDLPHLRLAAAAAGPQGRGRRWTPPSISKATPPRSPCPEDSPLAGKTVSDARGSSARARSRSSRCCAARTRRYDAGRQRDDQAPATSLHPAGRAGGARAHRRRWPS